MVLETTWGVPNGLAYLAVIPTEVVNAADGGCAADAGVGSVDSSMSVKPFSLVRMRQ